MCCLRKLWVPHHWMCSNPGGWTHGWMMTKRLNPGLGVGGRGKCVIFKGRSLSILSLWLTTPSLFKKSKSPLEKVKWWHFCKVIPGLTQFLASSPGNHLITIDQLTQRQKAVSCNSHSLIPFFVWISKLVTIFSNQKRKKRVPVRTTEIKVGSSFTTRCSKYLKMVVTLYPLPSLRPTRSVLFWGRIACSSCP